MILKLLFWSLWMIFSSKETTTSTWKISSGSVVEVKGSSNVNKFECNSMSMGDKDQLISVFDPAKNETEWNGGFLVHSKKFECNNAYITGDFHNTVRADKFPEIKIKFIQLKKNSGNSAANQLDGKVDITIVGVTKRYPLACFLVKDQAGNTRMKGEQKIFLSHFGIEPEAKLFGTVKVKDEISVSFSLVLKQAVG